MPNLFFFGLLLLLLLLFFIIFFIYLFIFFFILFINKMCGPENNPVVLVPCGHTFWYLIYFILFYFI
jgi:hypothetical protein